MAGEEDDDEDDDTDGEMMAVEQDGQQYVVLEVIQLQDGDGEQAVAVVTGDAAHTMEQAVALHTDLTDDEDVIETLRNSRKLSRKDALTIRKRIETEKDMQNCFGFDDEGDDVDDEAAKTTIQLLEAIH